MQSSLPSTASSALRTAVIGHGQIGRQHARAIAGSPHARLVAVCDVDPESRERALREFEVKAYDRLETMFEREQLDAVTVATPDHLHVEATLAAIAAGCHVFCEKPLADTSAQAQQMIEAASQSEVYLAVDYNRRFGFAYRTARELFDAGRIGSLECCLIRVTDGLPSRLIARHPHVMFTTLLTHHFDLMRHFGGEIRRLTAFARPTPAGALLTCVTLALEFEDGALGTIVAAYREGQTRTAEWLELSGTLGSIVAQDVTGCVTLTTNDPDQIQVMAPNLFTAGHAFYDSLVEHLQTFLEHVAHGIAPPVTGLDGLAGLKLAEAAVESLRRRTAIEL